jgi:hypothetical protein
LAQAAQDLQCVLCYPKTEKIFNHALVQWWCFKELVFNPIEKGTCAETASSAVHRWTRKKYKWLRERTRLQERQ